MSEQLFTSLVSIATAIVGVAIIAVLVSKKADTANVINAAGSAFGYDLGVAVNPYSGAPSSIASNNSFSAGNFYG